MQRDDDGTSVTDRRFVALVAALGHEDPRFMRSVADRRTGRMGVGNLAVVAALAATVLLGAVPLGLGLHLSSGALIVLGAIGCVLLPVVVPLALVLVLRRVRPAWR